MNAEEKKLLVEFFGKTLNLTAEDVAPIFEKKGDDEELKPEAGAFLAKHDATRIKTIKGELATLEKDSFDKGYKKAQAETLPKLEKSLKEKFGVDSDKQGLELVEEIVALKTKAPELEDDKVKVHPLYTKAEKEFAKKLKDAEDVAQKKYDDREKELAREKTFGTITKTATEILSKLNPIFGTEDKAKIQNQIDRGLLSDLKQYEFVQQNDEIIVMKEGKRLEDAHGKAISFDAFVKENASKHWDFAEGSERQGAGASNDEAAKAAAKAKAAAGAVKYKGQLPKTDADFQQKFAQEKDPLQRVALSEEYEASQQTV